MTKSERKKAPARREREKKTFKTPAARGEDVRTMAGGLTVTSDDFFDEEVQEGAEGYQQFLTFETAGGVYAIDILDTHEILKPAAITRVPNVQADALGVINLRGNIIPIVDLQKKFKDSHCTLEGFSRIIVVNYKGKFSGFIVDRVLEVARVAESKLEASEVRGLSNQYISGVGRTEDRIFLILNLDRLLNFAEPDFTAPSARELLR